MTLYLPPFPASMQLPSQNVSSAETWAYLNDVTRVDVSGNTRVDIDGNTRVAVGNYLVYGVVLGQVPNMSSRISLPE
jgi:hypothetical protein